MPFHTYAGISNPVMYAPQSPVKILMLYLGLIQFNVAQICNVYYITLANSITKVHIEYETEVNCACIGFCALRSGYIKSTKLFNELLH